MTSFALSLDKIEIGQKSTTNPVRIKSYSAIEDIPFGVAVSRVLTDGITRQTQVKNWAAGGVFAGITVYTQTATNSYDGTTGSKVKAKTMANIAEWGDFEVLASVAVNAGDVAYIVADTGLFTNVATNNIKVGRFQTSTVNANEQATLYINF